MCSLEKRGSIFLLTLTGENEHRMNPSLIDSIKAALHRAKTEATGPSVLITTAHGKFFSNGYDLAWSASDPTRADLMTSKFRSLIRELMTFPMPTIAAVTGHASAAGFVLALGHDYILMRGDRGVLYMSEQDIGFKIPTWFVNMVDNKIGSPAARRDVILKSAKLTAAAALDNGIIDSAHGSAEETIAAAVRMGEELVGRKWDGHVYAANRITIYADLLRVLGYDETVHGEAVNVRKRPASSKL